MGQGQRGVIMILRRAMPQRSARGSAMTAAKTHLSTAADTHSCETGAAACSRTHASLLLTLLLDVDLRRARETGMGRRRSSALVRLAARRKAKTAHRLRLRLRVVARLLSSIGLLRRRGIVALH